MKRTLLLTLFTMIICTVNGTAADYFIEDGICYFPITGQNNSVEVGNQSLVAGSITSTPYAGKVVVPATVTHEMVTYNVVGVTYNAFFENKNVTSVELPNGILSIGQSAFYGCRNLTSVNLPSTLEYIAPFAFAYSGIKSAIIPEGVMTIYPHVFDSCDALEAISFPTTLKTIGEYGVFKCTKLSNLIIPSTVTSIGEYAFSGCTSLKSLDYYAANCGDFTNYTGSAHPFFNCPLEKVVFESTVTHLPAGLLYPSEGLKEIYSYISSPLTIGEDVFHSVDKPSCKLYVPENSVDLYKTAEVWKEFSNILAVSSSGIAEDSEDMISVAGSCGKIVIMGAPEGTEIRIYSINGIIVYTGTACEVPIDKTGLYVVKVGNVVKKIILR